MHTCDEMNKQIVGILRAAADETKPEDQVALYAAQRIEELEQQLAVCREELAKANAACGEMRKDTLAVALFGSWLDCYARKLFWMNARQAGGDIIGAWDEARTPGCYGYRFFSELSIDDIKKRIPTNPGTALFSQLAAADRLRDAAVAVTQQLPSPMMTPTSAELWDAIRVYSAARGK